MELYRAARDGKDVAEVKAALEARRAEEAKALKARRAEEAKAKLDSAMVRCAPCGWPRRERHCCFAALWWKLLHTSAVGHHARQVQGLAQRLWRCVIGLVHVINVWY